MSDQLNVLRTVVERLESSRIPYMLTGSTAMNFYAIPRMTRDIDLIAEIALENTTRFCDLFKNDFYIEQEDVSEAIRSHGSFNIIHNETLVKVDILIRKREPYRTVEFERRKKQEVSGFNIQIVSPEDLVLSKLFWAKDSESEFQIRDARNIVDSIKELDWQYMTKWAQNIGIAGLLSKLKL